jgi:hypothetical protein
MFRDFHKKIIRRVRDRVKCGTPSQAEGSHQKNKGPSASWGQTEETVQLLRDTLA